MIILSALFAALCMAAAGGSLHAHQPYLAALWAFGGGWWGHRAARDGLARLFDRLGEHEDRR